MIEWLLGAGVGLGNRVRDVRDTVEKLETELLQIDEDAVVVKLLFWASRDESRTPDAYSRVKPEYTACNTLAPRAWAPLYPA
jgi:hypothetical protein